MMCEKTSGITETKFPRNEKLHENRPVQFYHSLENVWKPDALAETFICLSQNISMYVYIWGLIKYLSKFLNYLRPMSEGFTNNVGGDSVYISGNMHEVYNMLFKRV
jgi:hypothetical protein